MSIIEEKEDEEKEPDVNVEIEQITRNGVIEIIFNVPLVVPNFVNPSNDTLSKKRKLQTNGSCDQEDSTEGPGLFMSDIDVSRDLFNFYYVSNADQEKF